MGMEVAESAPSQLDIHADLDAKEGTPEEFFLSFRSEQQAIEQEMAALTASSERVHELLDALLLRAQALEASFLRSAHLLPKYDLQQYRSSLKALTTGIGARREELAPRKKFSFKRKEKASKEASCGTGNVEPGQNLPQQATPPSVLADSSPGEVFEGLQAISVVKSAGEIAGKDVSLKSLSGCRILLLDHVGALHCHSLRRCEVIIGSIESSALLYDCHDCVITLAGKQLRLHDSDNISLHLHTLSSPVIEHCHHIVVSPFNLTYSEIEAHWSAASLGALPCSPETTSPWADVQDFNWHKRQASPNWCIMPKQLWPCRLEFSSSSSLVDGAPVPPTLEELTVCQTCFDSSETSA